MSNNLLTILIVHVKMSERTMCERKTRTNTTEINTKTLRHYEIIFNINHATLQVYKRKVWFKSYLSRGKDRTVCYFTPRVTAMKEGRVSEFCAFVCS